jgi:hypothetical protein
VARRLTVAPAILAALALAGCGGTNDPPAEAEADFQRYLDARAEVVATLEHGLDAAREGDGEAYESARDDVADGAPARERLARRAGLRRCAAGEKA